MNKKITHKVACEMGVKWLKSFGCSVILEEFVSMATECPDVLGFKSTTSIMIEAKVSRADFLKDKKKWFRNGDERGVGNYRFYICPDGMIKKEEITDGWGLIYIIDEKPTTIIGPIGNYFGSTGEVDYKRKNYQAESMMLISALRRVKQKEINNRNFKVYINKNKENKNEKKA